MGIFGMDSHSLSCAAYVCLYVRSSNGDGIYYVASQCHDAALSGDALGDLRERGNNHDYLGCLGDMDS